MDSIVESVPTSQREMGHSSSSSSPMPSTATKLSCAVAVFVLHSRRPTTYLRVLYSKFGEMNSCRAGTV
jgi:hypothetical protein